jgi:outer membrane biosynthesis protein TonB
MNRFIRMSYGHGGTKFEKVLVSVPPPETAPTPLWQRLLMLVAWTIIPVLVCLYALPSSTPVSTIIDITKLDLKPPPEPERRVIKEPPPPKPEEKLPEPPPPEPVQATKKPKEQPQEVQVRPEINRPTQRVQEVQDYQPRIARERVRPGSDVAVPTPGPIRRQAAQSEAPAATASITRTRGAAAVEAPGGTERVVPLRRAPAAEGNLGGLSTGPRVITRRERTSGGPSGNGDIASPRITASRGRAQTSGTGTETGRGVSSMDMSRISLMSLQICANPQMEEDAIKAVLSVVGSRDSCTDQKGLFQFMGTARISSFNLMISPAKGRKPTNRCEELENAYRCLKTH